MNSALKRKEMIMIYVNAEFKSLMITKYFSGGFTTVKNEVKSLESDEEQEQKFQPGGSNLKQVH